jgi:hypothetical protein
LTLHLARAALVFIGLVMMSWPVAAQGVEGPTWEMGWVTDVDPKYLVDLEDDWDLSGVLVIYVSNDGPAELNLDLTYDYDEESPFVFDGPESVSVAGNTNDTFTVTITGGTAEEVRSFSPSSKIELTVVGAEQVGTSTLRTQEIQADVAVPRMYRLIPEALLPTETLFAGSWVEFTLEVSNLGNTQDAISAGTASIRSCPHLSVAGLDQLEDTVVQVTTSTGNNKAEFTLRLEATSSHQERTCEVSVSVKSEGDGTERSSTINVNVKAPQVAENEPTDDEGGQANDLEDGNLFWMGTIEQIMVCSLALLWIERRLGLQR